MNKIIKKQVKKTRKILEEDWPQRYLEKISCPLCSTQDYKILYKNTYARIVKCTECNLVYTNPRLKAEYLKRLYNKSYFQNSNSSYFGYENYLGDRKKIIKTFNRRLKDIEQYINHGKLLDVGCATGFFLKSAYDRNWTIEGLEISSFAARIARSQFGFKVFEGELSTISKRKKEYDLITLWDVIEHFYNPKKELKIINELLKDGGILVISTPNVGSFPSLITQDRWIGYKLSDEHLMYFSKNTISNLLKDAGFDIIKITHVGKHVSLSMFADRVSLYNKFLGSIFKKISLLPPKEFNIYINPRDIMCVYAVKRGNT